MKTSSPNTLAIILLISASSAESKRDFRVLYDNVKCRYQASYFIQNFDCQLKQHENRSYLNVTLLLSQPVPRLEIRVLVDVLRPNMPRFNIVNLRLNACNFLIFNRKNRFFNIISNSMQKFLNEMPQCPLKAHFNYTLVNYYYDEEDLPLFMPTSNFNAAVNFLQKGKTVAYFTLYGKIVNIK